MYAWQNVSHLGKPTLPDQGRFKLKCQSIFWQSGQPDIILLAAAKAYLSEWEFGQELVLLVGLAEREVFGQLDVGSRILGRDQSLKGAKVVRVSVQSLKRKETALSLVDLKERIPAALGGYLPRKLAFCLEEWKRLLCLRIGSRRKRRRRQLIFLSCLRRTNSHTLFWSRLWPSLARHAMCRPKEGRELSQEKK